ncbi:glycosyltransferase family 2 protein [Flavobacterium restrictum]|uniref:Glycosyltransferase family 2 protein n=1 Tax=Flavobacterium restrictum TaxID=2594428 RepID=A0A553E843_9FLAO|nr:glycosyltransferase family 2 protein [Flavobacterium restrictum]TRX41248.1 glycosyltransferase family 2 protein [Flavobacterium restrictum]
MKETNPLISVIITTYNRENYLEEAILSVVNQTYTSIEILVVDDGSSVNYAESICEKYANCSYNHKTNGGLSSARNFGITLAKGAYIAFLDDDDFWESSKIEQQIAILISDSTIDCVHSSAAIVDCNGKMTGSFIGASIDKAYKRSGYVFWNALGCWVVKSPTPLIRKKVFQPDLLFDETIKVGEDVDFYQRMFYRHKVSYIDKPLAFYREYENTERLSLQTVKYIGIENKMYFNFKKMGIKNKLILHLIAIKLLKSAKENWNLVHIDKPIKINWLTLHTRPVYGLKNYFNQ